MPRILLSVFFLILTQHAMAAKPKPTTPAPTAKIVMVQPQAEQQPRPHGTTVRQSQSAWWPSGCTGP